MNTSFEATASRQQLRHALLEPRASATGPGAASSFRAISDPNSFQASLDRAIAQRDPDEARSAAEQFVATSLVLPVLAHMREHNNAAPPFAPTQAERHFGAMLDGELADRIVKASNFPIVERLARDLQQNTPGAETAG